MRVQAELGAGLSFREAARVMSVLLPRGKAANLLASGVVLPGPLIVCNSSTMPAHTG